MAELSTTLPGPIMTDNPQDPIKHVVLLIMENHSFDQMLGSLKEVYPNLEGVDEKYPGFNRDGNGVTYYQKMTTEVQMVFDPKHEHVNVMSQLEDGNGGFVQDFASAYPASSTQDRQDIMGYYPLGFLPALHTLGRQFTVCDHWFSSLPGPTWPNRFFALSGTSSGRVIMPSGLATLDPKYYVEQTQETIFTRLTEAGKNWKIYFYDFPSSLVMTRQREATSLAHYENINNFFEVAQKDAGEFPDFVFIEPQYFGVAQNDDHPPHNVMKAEKLIADVYNAIRSNHDLWNSTLFVVVYDEHGGFYDHVSPPATVPPDSNKQEYSFDRLGVRVPAILVSPWVTAGVESTQFDHTSLLKYLVDKWSLRALGNRTASANSIAHVIRTNVAARTDTSPFIRVTNASLIPPDTELEKWDKNSNQEGLHGLADFLLVEMDKGMAEGVKRIAEAATATEVLASIKGWFGRALIWMGQLLIKDLQKLRNDRLMKTKSAVARLKESPLN